MRRDRTPNKEEFSKLYENYSQAELAKHYKCSKRTVQKWILMFDLQLRCRGGGNNRKYNLDEVVLRSLVEENYTNREICEKLNIKTSSLVSWLRKFNIRRVYSGTDEKRRYCRKVRILSEKMYVKYKSVLNPNNYPRTLCGVPGGYQLDHIVGVMEAYYRGIPEEQCASLSNLQFISWQENLSRRKLGKYGYKRQ